jgi:hypothetical protein
MNNQFRFLTFALFATTTVAGCSRDNERRPATSNDRVSANEEVDDVQAPDEPYTPSAAAETRSAAASLTQSRCSREQRCENIGPGKKYSSFADCEAEIGNDWRQDLNARECTRGVDQAQLDECLAEVRNEDCGNPFDSLGRIAACTQAQICAE